MESINDWKRTSQRKIECNGYMVYKNDSETPLEYQAWRPGKNGRKILLGIFSNAKSAIKDCYLDAKALRSSN